MRKNLLGFWGGAPKNGSHGGKCRHYLQPTPTISGQKDRTGGGGGVHEYGEVP